MIHDIKLEPYNDFEEILKKTNEYINRILYGANLLEQRGIKPVVFMSLDVISVISRGSESALFMGRITHSIRMLTVCGYEVKTTYGENELYVGFAV